MVINRQKEKLLKDFELPLDTELIPAILIHKKSEAAEIANNLNKNECKWQNNLKKELEKIMGNKPLKIYFHEYKENDVELPKYPSIKKNKDIKNFL